MYGLPVIIVLKVDPDILLRTWIKGTKFESLLGERKEPLDEIPLVSPELIILAVKKGVPKTPVVNAITSGLSEDDIIVMITKDAKNFRLTFNDSGWS